MMRLLCASLIACAGLPVVCHAATGESAFTEDMLKRVRSAKQGDFRIFADEPLVLQNGKVDNDDYALINLHRIYHYCLNAPAADCEASKDEFVAKIGIKPPGPKRENLRVIVRDASYVDYVRRTLGSSGNIIEPKQIGDDLFAILAFDGPDTIAVAMADTLKDVQLTAETAWPLGMSQTKARLPALPDGKALAQTAVVYEDKEYLGSLLADIDGWRAVASAAGPDMFVTVVSDQFVFVGRIPDGPNLDRFKQTVAEDCAGQQRCISDKIYRLRDGCWKIVN